jgi:DNA gyrase subunit B
MKPLLEQGYIYIAQPPLYKVKRGKREEYIETEKEMNKLILDLGTEGLKFSKIGGSKKFNNTQLKDILNALVRFEQFIDILSKQGIDGEAYIEHYEPKRKAMPKYIVEEAGEHVYVYDDVELAKINAGKEEPEYIEVFESETLVELEKTLNGYELSLTDYFIIRKQEELSVRGDKKADKQKEATKKTAVLKPLYMIEEENDRHEFFGLREVLEYVRAQAQKGIYIQRYKGLGEMNPHQLWETTMDPEHRTILQISLDDAVAADSIFSMLMGDEVAPRREFIETNAHMVKELDV